MLNWSKHVAQHSWTSFLAQSFGQFWYWLDCFWEILLFLQGEPDFKNKKLDQSLTQKGQTLDQFLTLQHALYIYIYIYTQYIFLCFLLFYCLFPIVLFVFLFFLIFFLFFFFLILLLSSFSFLLSSSCNSSSILLSVSFTFFFLGPSSSFSLD